MRRIANNREGYALFVGIFLAIFLGVLLAAAVFDSEMRTKSVRNRRAAEEAFYAAESGLETALYELRRNKNWNPAAGQTAVQRTGVPPPQTTGFYTLQQAPAPDDPRYPSFTIMWLRADGTDPDREVRRSILGKVLVFNPTDFFISSLADLRMGSGAYIKGDMIGRDIYFEVNESLPDPDDKKIVIDGNIYYFRDLYGDTDPSVEFLQNPPQLLTSITYPGVDTQRYRNLAQVGGRYVPGSYVVPAQISKEQIFSDPDSANGVIFAEGDIYITGEYTDSLLFVAGGNIYLTGDVKAEEAGTPPQLGLYAKKDIIVPESSPDNMKVEAFLVADGEGDSYGQVTAEGDKLSKGVFDFKGAMSVRGLQDDNSTLRTAINLNVYSNRNYVYDPSLKNACTIPFMTYVANVIDWQEINPNDAFPPP